MEDRLTENTVSIGTAGRRPVKKAASALSADGRAIKKAVIMGPTGAIGTALAGALAARGISVLALCRKDSARIGAIPVDPMIQVGYCSLREMSTYQPDESDYDAFFHLGWAGTTGAARNDAALQTENIRYTLDAVGLAQRFGCKVFVGAGSQAEYGRVEGELTPDTPAFPENGYGIAKLAAGSLSRLRAAQLGMAHIWIRVLSVYGPNDTAGSLISMLLRTLKAGGVPQLTKGEQIWDYLYSGDAAEAFIAAAQRGRNGGVYVLGSGKGRPLREYAETLRDIAAPGAALEIGAVPYGEKQVMHLVADVSDLTRDTGWEACTSFDEGIRSML